MGRIAKRKIMQMKGKMKLLLAVCSCLFGVVFQIHAQGHIVANGVITNDIDGIISVLHNPTDPANGGYTGFSLSQVSGNNFQFSGLADIGVRVFLVSFNDPVSLQSILAQSYTELLSPNSYRFALGVPFYVGLYTGNMPFAPQNGIYDDPLFGWAELKNVSGTIQLLDSALEYQGGGIFAGTQNIIPVPEPSTLCITVSGLAFLAWRRWRR